MIREKIDKIINKYYNETYDCYNSLRYVDDEKQEIYMEEEIKEYLTIEKAKFQIKTVTGYSNCAYNSSCIAVAWTENNGLNLLTMLLEDY